MLNINLKLIKFSLEIPLFCVLMSIIYNNDHEVNRVKRLNNTVIRGITNDKIKQDARRLHLSHSRNTTRT